MAWDEPITANWARPENNVLNPAFQGMEVGLRLGQASLAAQQHKVQMAAQIQEIAARGFQLQAAEKSFADTIQDQRDLPAWLADHPTWSDRQGSTPPAPRSAWGEKFVSGVRQSDNQNIAKQTAIKDTSDFIKRMDAISPDDRAAIKGMTPNKDGTPSAQQFEALGYAEQTSATKAANTATAAEIEAKARGDQQTTTVGPKGVTTKFTPPKADSMTGPLGQSATWDLPDGSMLVRMAGSKQVFHIKGETSQKMSVQQLQSFSKSLKQDNPDDPTSKKIDDYLSTVAAKQVGGKTPTPEPVLNLPKSKNDLKKGQKYKTAHGDATWDGTQFVQ